VPSEKNYRTRGWKILVAPEKRRAEHVTGKFWCCRKKEHMAEKVHLPLRKIFVLHQTKLQKKLLQWHVFTNGLPKP